ncbi:hypothetical protein MMC25_006863 [Agyrium rufum]|nr:hypothetical protein [Agyrium rufum]
MLFGESTLSLRSDESRVEAEKLILAFDQALSGVLKRRQHGHFNFLLGRQKEWKDNVAFVHAYVEHQIDRAIQSQDLDSRSSLTKENPFTFLDELLLESDERDFLRNQLLNVFFPARHSSAVGISLVFFVLARNPKAFARIRSDVLKSDGPMTADILISMSYLQQTIKESFRLYTSAGRAIREALEDCTLRHGGGPDGQNPIFVSKSTKVDMDFEIMHRDPSNWGENADDFVPERWDDHKPNWEYIPFIKGPRTCPAQQMVYTQFAYIICFFAKRFTSIENTDGQIRLVEEFRMVKQSRNGVKVGFTVP